MLFPLQRDMVMSQNYFDILCDQHHSFSIGVIYDEKYFSKCSLCFAQFFLGFFSFLFFSLCDNIIL